MSSDPARSRRSFLARGVVLAAIPALAELTGGSLADPASAKKGAADALPDYAPNLMLIPGTSSVDHLGENIAGAALALPPDAVAELNAI